MKREGSGRLLHRQPFSWPIRLHALASGTLFAGRQLVSVNGPPPKANDNLLGLLIMKSTVQSRSGNESQSDVAMDVNDALQRLGNDEELLRDIVQIYLEDAPAILDKIHAAVSGGDSPGLQRAAHSLKGLAATLSAHDVVGVASRLEHMGATRNLADSINAVIEVDHRVDELNQAVQELLRRK